MANGVIAISGTTAVVQSTVSGESPISYAAAPATLHAAIAGTALVFIAGAVNTLLYDLVVHPSIAAPQDLKGKAIGVTRFGASSDFSIRLVLARKWALHPERDVTIRQLGDNRGIVSGLQAGIVQAAPDGRARACASSDSTAGAWDWSVATPSFLRPRLEELLQVGNNVPLAGVALGPPVIHPSKVIGAFANYRAHHREMGGTDERESPEVFLKAPSSIIGPGATIQLPALPDRVIHHEVELAVVIGRRIKAVKATSALFASAPARARWCFRSPSLIEYTAAVMTLEPGDLIATGTPEGVGPIRPGNTVTLEVSKIGRLTVNVRGAEGGGA